MKLEAVSLKLDITLRARNLNIIAIKLKMLMQVFNRVKCNFTLVTRHTLWTLLFDMSIKLKKIIRTCLIRANRRIFVIMEINLAAMALFQVRN